MLNINCQFGHNTIRPAYSKDYRAFLLELGREMKEYDLDDFKFALKDVVPARKMEVLRHPRDVFSALEDQGRLGPDNFVEFREYLTATSNPKLIAMLDEYEDAGSKFPLKQRSDNWLEKDGYSVSVTNGRHFDTNEGEFVEIRSGSNYLLEVTNANNHRCVVNIQIDGYEVFANGFQLGPQQTFSFDRPSRVPKTFKFFALRDAPEGSGINKWRSEKNGLIEVKFTPEVLNMEITCDAHGWKTETIECSHEITDVQFLEMVSEVFDDATVTVMLNSFKPLGRRGIKLTEYGIFDGSRVTVNTGGIGGIYCNGLASFQMKNPSCKKNMEWRAGASTLEGNSDTQFVNVQGFPTNPYEAVTLNLRLVARENETPLPSTGEPTPLTKATLIPPPVRY